MSIWTWLWNVLTDSSDQSCARERHDDGGVAVACEEPPARRSFFGSRTPVVETPWWEPEGVSETTPLSPPKPLFTADARALEERLISHFDGHNLVLPPLPKVAENVLKRLRSSKCSMSEVANELASDPVNAADVLRMANSPLYRGVEKVASLQTAVSRLGASALKTLMLHQSLRSAMLQKKGKSMGLDQIVWRRAVAGAAIMRELGDLLGMDPEEAFLAGLLHDIGNLVVLRLTAEHERQNNASIDFDTFEYLCHETHQEFGELIADAWALPPQLKSLVTNHHAHPFEDDPLRRPRLMLILTDMICQMLGYMHDAQYDLLQTQAVCDLGLSDKKEFVDLLKVLPQRIHELSSEYR